ncbi:MAG: hypothetical protein AMXMBFR61_20870 [Fimbriimonadales bacterium]
MLLAAAGITLYAAISRPEPTVNASKGAVCPVKADCSSSCMPIGPAAAAAADSGDKAVKSDCGDPSQCPTGTCPVKTDETQ